MRLDMLASMRAALALDESMGFRRIAACLLKKHYEETPHGR